MSASWPADVFVWVSAAGTSVTNIRLATAFSEHFNGEQFELYAQGLADAERLDQAITRIRGRSTQPGQVKAFHRAFENLAPRLTLIAASTAEARA